MPVEQRRNVKVSTASVHETSVGEKEPARRIDPDRLAGVVVDIGVGIRRRTVVVGHRGFGGAERIPAAPVCVLRHRHSAPKS